MKEKKSEKQKESKQQSSKPLSQLFKEAPFSYDKIGKSYILKKGPKKND